MFIQVELIFISVMMLNLVKVREFPSFRCDSVEC